AKPLALAREGKSPADAAVVILPGPKNDLFQPELDALDGYIGRGGKALVMVNPFQNESLRKYLVKYGFVLDNDLVVESNPLGRLFGIGPEVPIIQQYGTHAITREMGGVSTLFPLTRSMSMVTPLPKCVGWDPPARTSEQSWGETNREELQRGVAKPDPADPKGPLTVAAVARKDKARIVVYGTSNLASNQFLNLQGNRDFFLNTVSWLAEEEDQISIRPKDAKQTPVFLNANQAQLVFLLPVVVVPGLVLLGGIVAVVRRGEVVKLKREADGWQILEPVTARGDRAKVDETLTTLTTARVDREIESAPKRLDQYGLDTPAADITLRLKDGRQLGLQLGAKNPTGVWAYAREAGKPAVFVVSDMVLRDVTRPLVDFRDRTVLAFGHRPVPAC